MIGYQCAEVQGQYGPCMARASTYLHAIALPPQCSSGFIWWQGNCKPYWSASWLATSSQACLGLTHLSVWRIVPLFYKSNLICSTKMSVTDQGYKSKLNAQVLTICQAKPISYRPSYVPPFKAPMIDLISTYWPWSLLMHCTVGFKSYIHLSSRQGESPDMLFRSRGDALLKWVDTLERASFNMTPIILVDIMTHTCPACTVW